MLKQRIDHAYERERALALGMTQVASELRLIDAIDYIAFIRTEQFGNLRALVNSSTELYLKPGTICFGLSGDINLKWGGVPIDIAGYGVPPSAGERLFPPAPRSASGGRRDQLYLI